jgi:hypothetical protein
MVDKDAGLNLKVGQHRVKGEQALALVRARKNIGGGSDLERITRQQKFLSAVVRQATDTGLLLRPDRLLPFLSAATDSLTVDTALAQGDRMLSLAKQFKDLGTSGVTFLTVPNKPYPANQNKVVWTETADALWTSLRNDAPLPGAAPGATPGASGGPSSGPSGGPGSSFGPAPEPLVVPASKITLRVLNGTDIAGQAGKAADAFSRQGFTVADVADAPAKAATTVIRYGPDKADSARTVAAAAPTGAKLELDRSLGGTITVVVGADWTGVRTLPPIGAGGAGKPATSPSPTPTPLKTLSAADDRCL